MIMFRPERIIGVAMLCFARERLITVLCNSPLHPSEVAVVELATTKESFEGAICLNSLTQFASLMNLHTSDVYIREQSESVIEIWLFNRDKIRRSGGGFDDDPTPVERTVARGNGSALQPCQ